MVVKKFMFSLKALRDVLVAGSASWLPGVIGLLGRWLDVLALFGTVGAVGLATASPSLLRIETSLMEKE